MKLPVIFFVIALYTGCCIGNCKPKVIYIPVPVACPAPPKFEPLDLPMWYLSPSSGFDEIVQAHRASEILLQGRVDACMIALDAYREDPKTKPVIGPPAPPPSL